ncbi:MAG: Hpt domain-containing protein [Chloroflexi bacterium]|nr:Hpt domain-containing protein [Chloroflexota bacterium]
MDIDPRLFLPEFQAEASEQLEKLTTGILAIEADPTNRERIQELFRAAHTIKGSARMLGFSQIGELAHRLEDVLHAIRDDRLAITPRLCDLLLEATDALDALVRDAVTGAASSPDPAPLVASLVAALAGGETGRPGGSLDHEGHETSERRERETGGPGDRATLPTPTPLSATGRRGHVAARPIRTPRPSRTRTPRRRLAPLRLCASTRPPGPRTRTPYRPLARSPRQPPSPRRPP